MKKIISIILVAGVLLMNTIGVFSATKTIDIPRLNGGETRESATRTGNFSYTKVYLYSVYPVGNYKEDTFTKIRVKLRDSNNVAISGEKQITEGSGAQKLYINEGYLGRKEIKFCFYGNSKDYPAKASVGYFGL